MGGGESTLLNRLAVGEDVEADKANEEQGEAIGENGFAHGLAETNRPNDHECKRESLSELRETAFKHEKSP
jgi:hypothetical protein